MLEIAAIVFALESRLDDGRHRQVPVHPEAPLVMVQEAIRRLHYYDRDVEFDWIENAEEMLTDERTAGTLSPAAVDDALAAYPEALADLRAAGAAFGFDAYWQNACAAPTPFLLVIDQEAGIIHGIDLQPCRS